jgi:hypothetical protein
VDVKSPDVENEGQGEGENRPEDGDEPAQQEAGDEDHEAEDQDDVLFVCAVRVVKHCWRAVLATLLE